MADLLPGIVESNAEAQQLATGFGFTEGPLWHSDGYWLFVDIRASLVHRMTPDGNTEVYRDNSGGSNGLTFDLAGNLVLCEGDNRQLARRSAAGSYAAIATHIDGKRINRPNDVVGRSDGSLYFTDPSGRLSQEERELDFSGVHRVSQTGDHTIATRDTEYPNGLAFSPDESVLYVAITRLDDSCIGEKERGEVCEHQFIRAFDVAADGSLSNNRVFATMYSGEDGVPDGMKVDVEGRVYCTGPDGCWVFDSAGNHLGTIRLPEIPANCAWGGEDNRTMLFTARTSVYSLRMTTPGTSIPRE